MQQHICWQLPAFCTTNCHLQLVTQYFSVTCTIYYHVPLWKLHKDWSLWVSEQCGCNFSCWLRFLFLYDRGCYVFLSHILTSAVWLAVVDEYFATSSMQLKKTSPSLWYWPNAHTVAPVSFCGLFWNPPCTNFTEVTCVADDFRGSTMTNPHFVDSHPTAVESWCMDLLTVHVVSRMEGYSNILHQFSHAYMLLFGKILLPYSADSIQWICTPLSTISPQKLKHCMLLFFFWCIW